jgi:hypothetical protein
MAIIVPFFENDEIFVFEEAFTGFYGNNMCQPAVCR